MVSKHENNLIYLLMFTIFALLTNLFVVSFCKSGVLLVLFMFMMLTLCVFENSTASFKFFILFTVLQNFLLIVLAFGMDGIETKTIILFKELIVYISAALFFINTRLKKMDIVDVIFTSFILYSIINLLLFHSDLALSFVGLRQVIVPFACFYFGMSLKHMNEHRIEKICRFIVTTATFVALIGFIIMMLPVEFWSQIGYGGYWFNKTGSLQYDLSAFYTWDLGFKMKRIVSTFADPLACSHFLGLAFVIAFTRYKKKRLLFPKMVLLVSLLLGMSKASVLLISCVVLLYFYKQIKTKEQRILFVVAMCCLGVIAIYAMFRYAASLSVPTSMGNHINSLLYGLKNISLVGTGYGSAGYNAIIMGAGISGEGHESFFATLQGQTGIIGIALFYGFLVEIIIRLTNAFFVQKNRLILIAIILLVSTTIETLLSASSISMLGTGPFFAVSGIIYNEYVLKKRKKKYENLTNHV